MKGRILLLDFALLALLGILAWRWRQVWLEAREREQRVLHVTPAPPQKAVPLPVLPAIAPSVAATYIDIAQKMLFARDRNPNVIIDATPPPPPKPMPPLPQFFGLLMGFGDPGIILSEKPGAAQRTYRVGEKVGPFKLTDFTTSRLVLDWDGVKVERRLDELVARNTQPQQAAPAAAAPGGMAPPAPTVQTMQSGAQLGPGGDLGNGYKACQPSDGTPSGTVQNGMRKTVTASLFGQSCRWEPVK